MNAAFSDIPEKLPPGDLLIGEGGVVNDLLVNLDCSWDFTWMYISGTLEAGSVCSSDEPSASEAAWDLWLEIEAMGEEFCRLVESGEGNPGSRVESSLVALQALMSKQGDFGVEVSKGMLDEVCERWVDHMSAFTGTCTVARSVCHPPVASRLVNEVVSVQRGKIADLRKRVASGSAYLNSSRHIQVASWAVVAASHWRALKKFGMSSPAALEATVTRIGAPWAAYPGDFEEDD